MKFLVTWRVTSGQEVVQFLKKFVQNRANFKNEVRQRRRNTPRVIYQFEWSREGNLNKLSRGLIYHLLGIPGLNLRRLTLMSRFIENNLGTPSFTSPRMTDSSDTCLSVLEMYHPLPYCTGKMNNCSLHSNFVVSPSIFNILFTYNKTATKTFISPQSQK